MLQHTGYRVLKINQIRINSFTGSFILVREELFHQNDR